MRLTQDQVDHFREQGYLAIPHFFSPREVKAIQAELDRLVREGMLRNVATDGDGKTHSIWEQEVERLLAEDRAWKASRVVKLPL